MIYNENAEHLALEVGALLDIKITKCQFNSNKNEETKINLLESVWDKDVYILG